MKYQILWIYALFRQGLWETKRRLIQAFIIVRYGDAMERRALSFALATLEHLERSDQWDGRLVRVIAHEACLRGLARKHEAGLFMRSTGTRVMGAMMEPLTKNELQNL